MLTTIINPQKISRQTMHEEIARVIKTTAQNIIKVEYWPHQIWVNITGKGGRILSYRSLPTWLQEIIFAIRDCTSLENLQKLGDLLKLETQRFSQYYATEYVEKMRSIWSEKRDSLREEEERTKPMREHQQKAQEWLDMWQKMISYSQNIHSLQYLYPEMERQSKEFGEQSGIIPQLLNCYQQRWQQLRSSNPR